MVITVPAVERPANGPRPINMNKDIPQVLELLKLAFGESLDADSRRILEGHSTISGQPAIMWRLNPMASRLSLGYVWEQDRRIVGNITLLSTKIRGRYLIVNVAVHPDFRRRGIARHLMNVALEEVRRQHGHKILLQVDKDNLGAVDLYESLHYQNLGSMTTWIAPAGRIHALANSNNTPIRPLRNKESQTAYELDILALASDLNWPEPIARDTYQLGLWQRLFHFVNGRHVEVWVTTNGRYLTGSAALWSEWGRTHQITLRIHPQWRGELERPLLAKILSRLPYMPRRNVRIDHPDDDDITNHLLQEANFTSRRTLTHMRLDVNR